MAGKTKPKDLLNKTLKKSRMKQTHEKNMKNTEESLRCLGGIEKRSNVPKIEISKVEAIENRIKALCEKVIPENFPKMMKNNVLVWDHSEMN